MKAKAMKTSEIGTWGRVWPIWLISMLGLWPLAGTISEKVALVGIPEEVTGSAWLVLALALLQAAVLLLAASGFGAVFAHRLGLVSILAHRLGVGRLAREIPQALGSGAALGVAITLLDHWLFMPLSNGVVGANTLSGSKEQALLLGVLYGGISEEVMMRWGLMTLICWGGMRLLRVRQERMPAWIAWGGIALSAIVFALGHLPAVMLDGMPDAISVIRILMLNTMAGIVFGWLYWRQSIESAFMSHAAVHGCFYLLT